MNLEGEQALLENNEKVNRHELIGMFTGYYQSSTKRSVHVITVCITS